MPSSPPPDPYASYGPPPAARTPPPDGLVQDGPASSAGHEAGRGPRPVPRRPGLVTALADTRFTVLATPMIIRWIYMGSVAVIGLATLFFFVLACWVATLRDGWIYGVIGMIAAPGIGLILVLIARVACELAVSQFHAQNPPGKH